MILQSYGHGGDIYRNRVQYDFSANVNPLGTPPEVIQAVRDSSVSLCAYPDPYCDRLRGMLSERLAVEKDSILCSNGAAELIFQFTLALSPRHALLPVPSFSEYEAALTACGCEIDFFPLKREQQFAVTEEILCRITAKTDLVVLCNPNNPTGLSIEPALLREILQRCRKTQSWLLLDECFLDLTDEEHAHSLLPLLEQGDRVLILRAFTKLYGMAGIRLGFGIIRNAAFAQRLCSYLQPWNVSTPAQAAGCAALGCEQFVQKTRTLIRSERAFLEEGLHRLGIPFLPSAANFIFFSGQPSWGDLLLADGLLIRSCANYRGLDVSDYRIAVRTHEENILLLNALGRLKGAAE